MLCSGSINRIIPAREQYNGEAKMPGTALPLGKVGSLADLAAAIRMRRKELNLTQADLAGVAGVGNRFIVDLEKGKPTLQIDKVMTVLSLLGLELYVGEKRT